MIHFVILVVGNELGLNQRTSTLSQGKTNDEV